MERSTDQVLGHTVFKNVSYTVTTIFTMFVLLFSERILQEDTFASGQQRIWATLLGTVIALVMVLVTVERDRRSAAMS